MRKTSLKAVLAAALAIAFASCGTGPSPSAVGPDVYSASRFQQTLEANAIPLSLPPGRAILVNIPSYELVAFEDGKPVLWSRVIIGTPEMRTPRIDTFTERVVFRPSWRPTPEMIASSEVADRVFPPGPGNPMGAIAITLQTRFDIALHDTNQPQLFARERRAFSHGCIRVEEWEALAAWLLDRDEDWVRIMAARMETQGFAVTPVPVLIRYYTRFPTEDGRVARYPDIYGLGQTAAAPRTQATKSAPTANLSGARQTCRIAM